MSHTQTVAPRRGVRHDGHTRKHGITGTPTNAETKRALSARVIRALNAAHLEPAGWRVRSLMVALTATGETPTDDDVTRSLMAAPWYPKPPIRRFGVGDVGWRTTT